MTALEELAVLALDCQATASEPSKGHLLELGWATAVDAPGASRLAKLPEGAEIPERVRRVTGLSQRDLALGEEPETLWRLVAGAADAVAEENALSVCPTVVHFAAYEEKQLRWLHFRAARESPFPFRFFCTHRIASRLIPELPRKSLRAVSGYFGHALPEPRRARAHARATLLVWRELVVRLREDEGVRSLDELFAWLREPRPSRAARSYPMPPAVVRDLPPRPGVYRMLRDDGGVLYVGKATSLHDRVSSYFRPKAPHADHVLEMLSQARNLDCTETLTALEAALVETDEIKRLEPPYNRALRRGARRLVFATRELDRTSELPDAEHRVGPLPASEALVAFPRLRAVLQGREAPSHLALGLPERLAPDPAGLAEGIALFRETIGACAPLAFGARLWPVVAEDESDEEDFQLRAERASRRSWSAQAVAARGAEILRRVAHLVRRAHWHVLLSDATLAWRSRSGPRVALVFERGRMLERVELSEDAPPPCPPGGGRPALERRALDLEGYDRMTVLTRELRRLLSEGREPSLRLDPEIVIEPGRLERLLRWV